MTRNRKLGPAVLVLFAVTALVLFAVARKSRASGTGTVTGHVYAGNTPVADCLVDLQTTSGGTLVSVAAARTDSQGAYTLSSVPVGSYTMVACDFGRKGAPSIERTIAVGDGTTTTEDFYLPAERVVTGGLAQAVEGVLVTAQRNGTVVAADRTDSNGAFSLRADTGALEIAVILFPESASNVVRSVASGSGDVTLSTVPVSVETGSISGTVTFPDGGSTTAAEGVHLVAVRAVGGVEYVFAETDTDSDGDYTLSGLPDGAYRVKSSHRYLTDAPWPTTAGATMPDPALRLLGPDDSVTVSNGGQTTHDVSMAWTGAVTVTLRDSDGQPVLDAEVSLGGTGLSRDIPLVQMVSGSDPTQLTASYGTTDPAPAGDYTITVSRDGESDYTTSVTLGAGQRSTITIDLP